MNTKFYTLANLINQDQPHKLNVSLKGILSHSRRNTDSDASTVILMVTQFPCLLNRHHDWLPSEGYCKDSVRLCMLISALYSTLIVVVNSYNNNNNSVTTLLSPTTYCYTCFFVSSPSYKDMTIFIFCY